MFGRSWNKAAAATKSATCWCFAQKVLADNGYSANLPNGAETRHPLREDQQRKKWKTAYSIVAPSALLGMSVLSHVTHMLTPCPSWLQIFGTVPFQCVLALVVMLGVYGQPQEIAGKQRAPESQLLTGHKLPRISPMQHLAKSCFSFGF